MKKYIIVMALSLFVSFNANAEDMREISFNCHDLAFTVIPSVNTISFSNIELFSIAEMISDIPIGYNLKTGNTINAKYHWNNTTLIKLVFDKEIKEYVDGEMADIRFSFDDNDGIYLEDQSLKCKAKVKNL
jgi:hypothetical protein